MKNQDTLFGYHSIYEALKAQKRQFYSLLFSKKRSPHRTEKIEALAKKNELPIKMVDPQVLDKMTHFSNHQGMALEASHLPLKSASQAVSEIEKREGPSFILILENIEDPHNLGALIRTALCAGVNHILIPKDRSCQPSSSVSRSSAGAMEHADIYMITNTASILRELKKIGVWVSGLDAKGDTDIFNADLTGDVALVIGGEHKGIRPLVQKECDFLLSIPNKGRINSLKASVAGGIAMYEALRQGP
jgi:23S rRNA (guanosine2251-2'-O)-methyltransferase